MLGALCLGIIFILLGLANIFLKDLAWDLTEWSNRTAGRVSERTSAWETMTTLIGIAGIVFGIILIIAAIS